MSSSNKKNALSIIHNGTPSAGHEMMKAKEHAESEKRRAELDKKRALAKSKPDEAHLYEHSLGGVGTHASVVIRLVHKDGSLRSYETCELSVDSEGLSLIVVCPSCIFRHGRRQEDSQLTLRSWHRRFTLDEFGRGVVWHNPFNPAEMVTLAGVIHTHDKQTCPVCHFAFHIEKSRDPNEPGVSVIREV